MKRLSILVLTVLLLCTALPVKADDAAATDLSRYLRFEQSGHGTARSVLLDDKLSESLSYAPYEMMSVTWAGATKPARTLCIQWDALPEEVSVRQLDESGALLGETVVSGEYDTRLPLANGAAKVSFVPGRKGMSFVRLALYSEGTLPEPFVEWEPTPDHLDYLIIATHPDDDVLFMGSIAPLYGAELGYTGTVAYVTSPTRSRVNEALMGAHAMGVTAYPIFLGFSDVAPSGKDSHLNRFLPEVVTLQLVRMLRQYRPLVVFTHDINGEYGHWQHEIVAVGVVDAVSLAADPSYDPASAAQYGVWQVQKCYRHLEETDPLVLDITTPLASMGGRTALQVAQDAFLKHRSQQNGRHWVQTEKDRHPLNRFGMVTGAVDAGEDVFDNIDPALLVRNLTAQPEADKPSEPAFEPEPTEPPQPTETAVPTEPAVPEDAPTDTPVPTETPAPTDAPVLVTSEEPVETEAPDATLPKTAPEAAARTLNPLWFVLIGGAILLILLLLILTIVNKRKER